MNYGTKMGIAGLGQGLVQGVNAGINMAGAIQGLRGSTG